MAATPNPCKAGMGAHCRKYSNTAMGGAFEFQAATRRFCVASDKRALADFALLVISEDYQISR